MLINEFGDRTKRKMILIHGFQSPWQVWEKYIEFYKKDFHVIVPVILGHDPDHRDDFISFSRDAREIEDYVFSRYGCEIFAIFGMSMGGVLAATLWQNRRLRFENVIFDGSPLVSVNGFVREFMLSFYLGVTHKTQQRDTKTLKWANAICPMEHMDSFIRILDNMSDTTIRNCLNAVADFKLRDDIDTHGTKLYYFHGTAMNEMLAKKSAKYLKKHYPDTVVKCFKGKGHCENSLFDHGRMIAALDSIFMSS